MSGGRTKEAFSCGFCHSALTKVLDCRGIDGTVRRRRICKCGRRFTTYELKAADFKYVKRLLRTMQSGELSVLDLAADA